VTMEKGDCISREESQIGDGDKENV
jgi:hypothetical protein